MAAFGPEADPNRTRLFLQKWYSRASRGSPRTSTVVLDVLSSPAASALVMNGRASGGDTDEVDFDTAALDEEARGADCRARRRRREEFLPDFVEGVEVVQIGQEHLRLDHAVE